MEKLRLGFALCGSYCTFSRVIPQLEKLARIYDVTPIMSENAYSTDTRFGKAEDFAKRITEICGRAPLHTIAQVEPIGPKKLLDLLVVAPCTGNTIAKLASGISDTAVTQAVKSHLRNGRAVIIAVSTNDALAGNARNIGALLAMNHYYFVPLKQDDPVKKPRSVVAEMERLEETVAEAANGRQIQPIFA